jgi:hypothetical protein
VTDAAACMPIQRVRDLIESVLRQGDFPGCDELVRQASSVEVVGGPITMIDLRVDHALAPSVVADGPIPLDLIASDAAGDPIGVLLIWVERGYLSCLEFGWWSDDPPVQLPSVGQVRVIRK